MADNATLKDSSNNDVVIAAKDIGGVKYPVHVLYDPLGNPVDFSGPTLPGGTYNSAPVARASGATAYFEADKYGGQRVSMMGGSDGGIVITWNLNNTYATRPGGSVTYTVNADAYLAVASFPMQWDAVKSGFKKQTLPSEAFYLASAAASDNASIVKATAGCVLKRASGYNAKASGIWLKIYDKATAPASTDTPKLRYYLPPQAAFNLALDDFIFQAGAGLRLTTDAADGGTTALAAGDVLNLQITLSQ